MLKELTNLKGAVPLTQEEQKTFTGGVTRAEYCAQLGSMLHATFMGQDGYQGDISYGMSVFYNNCGKYGYTID